MNRGYGVIFVEEVIQTIRDQKCTKRKNAELEQLMMVLDSPSISQLFLQRARE